MKKLALTLSLVAVAVGAWRLLRTDRPDTKLLFDRYWVDHMPRDPKEKFQAVFVSGEYPVGNFATRTAWTGQWEGFHYHIVPREEGTFDIILPVTNEQQRVKFTARRCNENGFNYCLEISGCSRGVKKYYSKKEWDRKGAALDAARTSLF